MSGNPGARAWEMIRKQAKQIGADVQSLATSYAIERFMSRLSALDSRGNITVKGGQSLGILFGNQMRPTKDLDINVSLDGIDDPIEWARDSVMEAALAGSEDGLIVDIANLTFELREHQGDGGLRISVPCSVHTCRTPFVIDVGVGNEITFDPSKVRVEGVLKGQKAAPEGFDARIYPHENTLAEKIMAKIEDGLASIRHKDFFDIWLTFETLKRVGDLRLLVEREEHLHEHERELVAAVKTKLSDGSLLDLPEVPVEPACMERLGFALSRTAGHRGTEIPDDLQDWFMEEFADDELHSSQWANWCRNQKNRLLFQPPGTEKSAPKEEALHVLIDNIGPHLLEIGEIAKTHAPTMSPSF